MGCTEEMIDRLVALDPEKGRYQGIIPSLDVWHASNNLTKKLRATSASALLGAHDPRALSSSSLLLQLNWSRHNKGQNLISGP
uniref:Uncharacterized protein n=1 Tax=Knipowitschia caucasica TaxID=637954 RepID=A0AAV2JU34_KNICA